MTNSLKAKRRRIVWNKTNGICAHCGKKKYGKEQQTIDHYVPKSYGGTYNLMNLMPLCKECNRTRGNKEINPFAFYKFAPKDVVYECIKYERKYFSHWEEENVG